ncbi:MAG: agmatine deiminase family protein [Desulfuromonadales bacterium]|nr:agmatine deiminase family protein [Desulfuromonadales bacterium]
MSRRLPAEWEAQDGVLLAWPHKNTDWEPLLADVEAAYCAIIGAILRFETVLLVVDCAPTVSVKLQSAGIDLDQVRLYEIPTDDTWARDFGPLTVMNDNAPRLLDFTFTGWGGKFPATQDNAVTRMLAKQNAFAPLPLETVDLILEGGGIESDGHGTLLTTTACLLNPNRNAQLDRAAVEAELTRYFGAKRILWLNHGYLAGDDTDSHIDTLARLAPKDTLVYQSCTDPADEHYAALQAMAAELRGFRTMEGAPYRLLPLPWPRPRYDAGDRLPATYANFLIINGAVLVPTYADPADAAALAVVAAAFPDREIIGINCCALIRQHGSLHCVTMQLPRGVLR